MKVSAKLSDKTAAKFNVSSEQMTVEANIPVTLAEKVALFGEDVVNASAEDSLVINVQALIRRGLTPKVDKEGKVTKQPSSAAEIQAAVDAWRPDVKTMVRQTAFDKAASSLSKLSPEEKAELLKRLQAG